MNKIKRFLKSVTFRRILVIFVVGLVSRCLVNYVYDINVFKDYTHMISIVYYGFMACFTGLVYEFPSITLNVFDIKLIRGVIKVYCENYFSLDGKDKILVGGDMFSGNINTTNGKELSKDGLVLKQDRNGENIDGLNEKFLEESKSIHQNLNNLEKNLKETISKEKGVLTNEEITKLNENIIKENIGKLKKEKSFRHVISDNRVYQGRNVFSSNNKDTVSLDESLRKREISKKLSTQAMIRKYKKG
jgi:hypothetical protein